MLLALTATGDLPPGIHLADWAELEHRFGAGSEARLRAFAKLRLLYALAGRTGKLARFLVFGSFVTAKPVPRDIDVVLIMAEDFHQEDAPREAQTLFSHADAEARLGASVFWLRQGMLSPAIMAEFLDTWQMTREGDRRGIVEVQA